MSHSLAKLAALSLGLLSFAPVIEGEWVDPKVLDKCPGYNAKNVKITNRGTTLSADLELAGKACNVFGNDIAKLALSVVYETATRIHVKITDPANARYEVPASVLPRPSASNAIAINSPQAQIQFKYTTSPFSFTIQRSTFPHEVLFSTASHPLIFEPQYLRLKTSLPHNANLYGLGEHTNTFRLPTHDFTRTMWSRDAYGISPGTNLYGNHPVYFEHRPNGATHGVFLLNSNGMDIKINDTEGAGKTTLEYNVIGGIVDIYFLAGSTTDPTEVARQYAQVVGTPAEVPYWSFGFHQCRFGYNNYIDVAGVISNYSEASIPLETMWTDIDYMDRRRIFTVDPQYFPLNRMREIVDYLHSHDQRFVLMTDPAVGYLPDQSYGPYDRGTDLDVWMKNPNGSYHLGLVWPGVTVYPDWFHPKIEEYWTNEFKLFYNPDTGLDIDGAWIDMNEPSSFCNWPCEDPFEQAVQQALPPPRSTSPPDPNVPIFGSSNSTKAKRAAQQPEDVLFPPYNIDNAAGGLSNKTAHTDVVHANGLNEYDAHNLYGTLMSMFTQRAMSARRPGKRTLIITRSTFAGAGAHVGKWLGDNFSQWDQYRFSIAGNLGMASIYQVPMVGSDICGYAGNTTETLCARWAMLGAFSPFMRNHNADTSISQEFYRWSTVSQAARNALDIRYRLLDYLYTTFHQAKVDGTPVLNPLWYKYPKDANTFSIDLQFLFGPSILVSPVTEENSTSVKAYFPNDIFYDFLTLAPFQGKGTSVTLNNVNFTSIPVHIRGGAILPLRVESAMTTTELRKKDFELVIAPSLAGTASGSLYVDDGESVTPSATSTAAFQYALGTLQVTQGHFGYDLGVQLARVKVLNVRSAPKLVTVDHKPVGKNTWQYDALNKVLTIKVGEKFKSGLTVQFI